MRQRVHRGSSRSVPTASQPPRTHSSQVFYNGQRIKVKSFQEYVELYLGPKDAGGAPPRVYERISDRWEVCIATTEGQFNQVSFVNSICTSKGGTHVNYVADQARVCVGVVRPGC